MNPVLSSDELAELVRRVFQPRESDRMLAVLVDLPDAAVPDNPRWRARRTLAQGWARELARASARTGLTAHLVAYRNVRMNNADLPERAWLLPEATLPDTADALEPSAAVPFSDILSSHSLLIAPTEFSATAPLKLLAPRLRFRAVTMPGFSEGMIPALRLDYGEINRRVLALRKLLDQAEAARIAFEVEGLGPAALQLDLRYRTAHASGGLFPEPGTAGNLPSGETYVVPYEGERPGEPSRSQGLLPVQLGEEVVVYEVENNRALRVRPGGAVAAAEAQKLAAEPAYGNLAELGLGVLSEFGVEPCGEVLLDEKLGLHIAFGRSDHFGGQVGAAQFSRPEAVVHIDRVYVRSLQPKVRVRALDLDLPGGRTVALMRDDRYAIDFGAA